MIIQKKDLIDRLRMCMPGIETGSAVLQGADCFVFHNKNIFTYNDTISVKVPMVQDEESLEGCVKAEEFYNLIQKLPSDEIKLTVTEEGVWLLKCGKARAEITLLDFDFETRLNNIKPKDEWIDLDEDFVCGIGSCKMVANKSPISGIYISGKDIISSDGNQINHYFMKKTELPKFWMSDKSATELLKIKNFTGMQIQGAWAHFKSEDGTVFSTKTLQAETYPADKIKNIIDTSDVSKAILHTKFPADMFNAIDRAVSFSINISELSAVRLTISKEKIEVSSERNSGKYSEKVAWEDEIKGEFEPFVVYVDAVMMEFVSQKSVEFYLLKGPIRNNKCIPRLLFVTESSKHLLGTLDADE